MTGEPALLTVEALAKSFGGFDVVEVNPLLDTSRISAMCGATLAFEFLSLLARARAS